MYHTFYFKEMSKSDRRLLSKEEVVAYFMEKGFTENESLLFYHNYLGFYQRFHDGSVQVEELLERYEIILEWFSQKFEVTEQLKRTLLKQLKYLSIGKLEERFRFLKYEGLEDYLLTNPGECLSTSLKRIYSRICFLEEKLRETQAIKERLDLLPQTSDILKLKEEQRRLKVKYTPTFQNVYGDTKEEFYKKYGVSEAWLTQHYPYTKENQIRFEKMVEEREKKRKRMELQKRLLEVHRARHPGK